MKSEAKKVLDKLNEETRQFIDRDKETFIADMKSKGFSDSEAELFWQWAQANK